MKTVVVLIAGALAACSPDSPPPKSERIDNVVRIFMRNPDEYTLLIQKPGSKVATERDLDEITDRTSEFIFDVPADKPMWVYVDRRWSNPESFTVYVTYKLHLHSVADLNGAGWNHGKFGSGQTQIIQ